MFNGNVVPKSSVKQPCKHNTSYHHNVDAGPESTRLSFAKLGNNRGVGRDAIPAELLKAGESSLATKYSEVNEKIFGNATWPAEWSGGRMVEAFKNIRRPESM